jgi:hypothetical protein
MKKLLLMALMLLVFAGSPFVLAMELDDEKSVTNQELQGTMIIRLDTRDNSAAYLKSDSQIANEGQAQMIAKTRDFLLMEVAQNKAELDADAGSSSWYFYNNYNYNYYVYWYGYYYNPIYTYNYGYYQYYYYCRNRWW